MTQTLFQSQSCRTVNSSEESVDIIYLIKKYQVPRSKNIYIFFFIEVELLPSDRWCLPFEGT